MCIANRRRLIFILVTLSFATICELFCSQIAFSYTPLFISYFFRVKVRLAFRVPPSFNKLTSSYIYIFFETMSRNKETFTFIRLWLNAMSIILYEFILASLNTETIIHRLKTSHAREITRIIKLIVCITLMTR